MYIHKQRSQALIIINFMEHPDNTQNIRSLLTQCSHVGVKTTPKWRICDGGELANKKTRKLPSRVKDLWRRNLTATTLISTNAIVLPQLLAPEVVCQI